METTSRQNNIRLTDIEDTIRELSLATGSINDLKTMGAVMNAINQLQKCKEMLEGGC